MPCRLLRNLLFVLTITMFCEVRGKTDNCPSPCSCTYNEKSVEFVNCSHLEWKNIPPKFLFPPSAVHLSLANNRFTVLDNGTFRNLTKLQSLDLSHNRLAVLEYSCFEGLESLEKLDMSYNSLKMTTNVYPPGLFRYLKQLKVLNIHGNIELSTTGQNYPDVALSDLQLLKELKIDGLSGAVFGQGFRKLKNLVILDMSTGDNDEFCLLIFVPNTTFSSFSNSLLSVLKLVRCKIYRIEPGTFSMLKHLTELDLSENHHLSFDGMRNASFGLHLTNIQVLRLNRINRHSDPWTLQPKDFVYFNTTTIKTLTLDTNRIAKIESGVIDLLPTSLELLSFRDNILSNSRFLGNLVRLNNLLVFDVSYQLDYSAVTRQGDKSKPTSQPHSAWGDTNDLIGENVEISQYVFKTHLSPKRLQQIEKGTNQSKYIPLSRHRQQKDDVIQLPVNVKKILANNLKLGPLPAPPVTFDSNNSLEYLDFSSNGVHACYGKWSGLHSLKFLNISDNAMFRLAPDTFGDVANLHTLLLNGNRLGLTIMKDTQFLTFSNQTKLTYLNLSDNAFSDLPEFIFAKQINLEKLDLQHNYLSAITFRMKSLNKIREIDLSYNTITDLSPVNMEEMDYLAKRSNFTIDLTGNSLKCTCDQLEQLRWMRVTKVVFRNLERYTCKANNGSVVRLSMMDDMITQMSSDCIAGKVIIICLAAFCGLCLLLALPALAYYKKSDLINLFNVGRRHIVPLRRNIQDGEAQEEPLQFAVYLSLEPSRPANEFVSRFQEYMENKDVSMYIPELDSNGGSKEIVEMVKAMNKSMCILALINNDYMTSFHRLYEFEMAVTEVIQNRFNNLIVVLLEDLDTKHFLMNDFVSMYCLENYYFDVRRSKGRLFEELENEIIRCMEYTKGNT